MIDELYRWDIVEVLWIDCIQKQMTIKVDDAIKFRPIERKHIGYFLHLTDECMIIASMNDSVRELEMVDNATIIPIGMIRSAKLIKKFDGAIMNENYLRSKNEKI